MNMNIPFFEMQNCLLIRGVTSPPSKYNVHGLHSKDGVENTVLSLLRNFGVFVSEIITKVMLMFLPKNVRVKFGQFASADSLNCVYTGDRFTTNVTVFFNFQN